MGAVILDDVETCIERHVFIVVSGVDEERLRDKHGKHEDDDTSGCEVRQFLSNL